MRCDCIYCLDDTILPQICIYESLLSHLDDSQAIVIAKFDTLAPQWIPKRSHAHAHALRNPHVSIGKVA